MICVPDLDWKKLTGFITSIDMVCRTRAERFPALCHFIRVVSSVRADDRDRRWRRLSDHGVVDRLIGRVAGVVHRSDGEGVRSVRTCVERTAGRDRAAAAWE